MSLQSVAAKIGQPEHTGAEPGYAPGEVSYASVEVREAVERVQSGAWRIPDFQREFVWKPYQLLGLVDSLWRNYPVGSLLLWAHPLHARERTAAAMWIADGQQRLTGLCVLMGRRPYWWSPESWESEVERKYQVFVDTERRGSPFVLESHLGNEDRRSSRFIRSQDLLELIWQPRETAERECRLIAGRLKAAGFCLGQSEECVASFLASVVAVVQRRISLTTVSHGREEVLEIFQRLNSRGMKFRHLLLRLAMKAAGWQPGALA